MTVHVEIARLYTKLSGQHISMLDQEWAIFRDQDRAEVLVDWGIPKGLARFAAGGVDYHGRPWSDEAQSWRMVISALAAGARDLLLAGGTGTGKSAAAARLMAQVGLGWWISARDYCAIAEWETNKLDRYRKRAALAVIDDVGTESARHRERIEDLIHARHGADRMTIITANMTADEFANAYDSRIVSRIKECGAYLSITEPQRVGERGAA